MTDDADSSTPSGGAPEWSRPPAGPPPEGYTSGTGPTPVHQVSSSPFRRHPVRWSVAAGGLAAILAIGGYGVTQAASSSAAASTASPGMPGAGTGTGGPPGASGSSGGAGMGAPGGSSTRAALGKGGTGGMVTSISGDTITLRSRDKTTVTVVVTSATVFKDGTSTASASALKKGDLAMVVGSTSSDGTVTATTITFGNPPKGAPGTATSPPAA